MCFAFYKNERRRRTIRGERTCFVVFYVPSNICVCTKQKGRFNERTTGGTPPSIVDACNRQNLASYLKIQTLHCCGPESWPAFEHSMAGHPPYWHFLRAAKFRGYFDRISNVYIDCAVHFSSRNIISNRPTACKIGWKYFFETRKRSYP